MIRVLQNWQEIGEATRSLQRKGLPTHSSVVKNWDLFGLYKTLTGCNKSEAILDLGCGSGETLKLLYALGFRFIYGIDLQIAWRLRVSQLTRMVREKSVRAPFHLYKGDITKTHFPNLSFNYAVCISVVEHGVDLATFFSEVHRLLKPSGKLFLTTDYWEESIKTGNSIEAFGLPWKIFSRGEIEEIIKMAQHIGLNLESKIEVPACSEKTVFW